LFLLNAQSSKVIQDSRGLGGWRAQPLNFSEMSEKHILFMVGIWGVTKEQFHITWTAYSPLKIKIFLWLVQHNRILTKDNLHNKCWQGDTKCIFCD
jgi:zinc-binding in reverse transcriptase